MSFVLRGNARSLHLSGEARPLGGQDAEPAASAVALGKPRVRRFTNGNGNAPASSHAVGFGPDMHPGYDDDNSDVPTSEHFPDRATEPKVDLRTNRRPPHATPSSRPPPGSARKYDFDDEHPTMAMDRDGRDVMPGGTRRGGAPPAAGMPAVPNFRTPQEMRLMGGGPAPHPAAAHPPAPVPWQVPAAAPSAFKRIALAPYTLWVVASVIAAMASYFVTPAVVAKVEAKVQHGR
jgi:hypothetical protein